MIKIVADDRIPFLKGALEPYADVVYLPGKDISRSVLMDADAMLIRTRTKCDRALLDGTGIRFIGTATIGFDHVDTQYCENKKIKWTNAPGCNSSSVQQYIACALLKIANDFRFPLREKTIGIIGVGNVGSKIEEFARILGMNVLLNDPPRAKREGNSNFVNIERVIHDADIITVHVPLSMVGEDKTYHLFNGSIFKKLKRSAWFFNSSRGEVVDTVALKSVLGSDLLGGAVLDVWENEPDIDRGLLAKTYIATPHIAGYSTDGKANGTAMVVNSLCTYFNLPQNDWYPDKIPQAQFPQIMIDCKSKSDEDVIREAVLHTYNIMQDDQKLRISPADFEKQRGDYPLRREFPAYTVRLKNCSDDSRRALEKIGFNSVV